MFNRKTHYKWLVVDHPSEKYESIGMIIPNIWKDKNVANHQPDKYGHLQQLCQSLPEGTVSLAGFLSPASGLQRHALGDPVLLKSLPAILLWPALEAKQTNDLGERVSKFKGQGKHRL